MSKGDVTVESHKIGYSLYELRRVTCGKQACGKCPHGPYWYETILLRNGRRVKKYVGKVAPQELDDHKAAGCTGCGLEWSEAKAIAISGAGAGSGGA
jgi:hypothetical protein